MGGDILTNDSVKELMIKSIRYILNIYIHTQFLEKI